MVIDFSSIISFFSSLTSLSTVSRPSSRIPIKSPKDIERMRVAGQLASEVLQGMAKFAKAGMTTKELDLHAAELMRERDCVSAFLGYRGFPAYTCISVNEEIVHGIGGERVIQPGDVLSVDVGIVKSGFIGDNATTVAIGDISLETKRLLAVTEQSLYEAIAQVRAGARLADVCGAVAEFCEPRGFTIVREFVGHGVGRRLHEEPQVPNYRPKGKSPILAAGMVLAIEPMVNQGSAEIRILDDGWTVITADGKPSAHFEHTVLVTATGYEILTDRPRAATPELLGIDPI